MNNSTPTKPAENAAAHLIHTWEENKGRKRASQTHAKVTEFRKELDDAHAMVLSHTLEEYKERQAQLFSGNLSAVDRVLILLDFARQGMLVTPDGWQEKPPTETNAG